MALPESGLVTDSTSRPPVIESLTARPRSLDTVETRSTAASKSFLSTVSSLVVVDRDDARVIGEGAVDQLGGQHHVADGEADLAGRQLDRDLAFAGLDQSLHFADRLARHDDAGHAGGARGSGNSTCARRWPSVATARSVAALAGAGRVQIDAVEIIARLFGRDRELGLVDQPLEVGGRQLERMASSSPAARSGKSLSGNVCSVKRERPARIDSTARSPEPSITICAPSGSLRTMS